MSCQNVCIVALITVWINNNNKYLCKKIGLSFKKNGLNLLVNSGVILKNKEELWMQCFNV